MKKILVDTNVILDIALNRKPFYKEASELIILFEKHQITPYISATTITDIYYIAKRQKGHEIAINFISNLLEIFDIAEVDKGIIYNSIKSNFKDFEDAIQEYSAIKSNINTIITRNKPDFIKSKLKIYTPKEYLDKLKKV